MFKSYTDVRDWLENFIPLVWNKGELGLERIENLLKLLGNPQKKFKSVHIAGTSGKGSTSFYTARLLQKSGFKQSLRSSASPAGLNVGLHISPHLVDIRERMQVFNDPVSKNSNDTGSLMPMRKFLRLFGEIKPIVEKIKKEKPELTPSYFEILVAASFKYFAEEKVDFAVVEVGLGGRLDATNVLMPEVSIITNIGLDHTEILGKTVEKIALEKAGIIKVGVPVVTGAKGAALRVIEGVAKEKGSKLYKFSTRKGLVIKVLEILKISTSKTSVEKVFDMTFPGRLEEIEKGLTSPKGLPPPPRLWRTSRGASVILDGAHNPDKVRFLIKAIKNRSTVYGLQSTAVVGSRWTVVLILAFKKGKDWKKMIDLLFNNLPVKQVIATKFYAVTDMGPTPSQRLRGVKKHQAVEPEEIRDYVVKVHPSFVRASSLQSTVYSNSQEAVFEALGRVKESKSQRDIVLVTGSLYLVGEVRTIWHLPSFT